jgi:hypothetical protein
MFEITVKLFYSLFLEIENSEYCKLENIHIL